MNSREALRVPRSCTHLLLCLALIGVTPVQVAAATLYLYDANGNLVATLDDQSVSWCSNAANAANAATCQTATTVVDGAVTTTKITDLAVTGTKIADGAVSKAKLAPDVRTIPAGTVIAYAGYTAAGSEPAGYLFCNGRAVSRTQYAALYAAIGITYGAGDGSTTFNVPDFRGVFLRGLDAGRGVDPGRALGPAVQADAIASHSHPFAGNSPFQQSMEFASAGGGRFALSTGNVSNAGSTGNSGGSETRPRNLAVNYLIAY